LADVLRPQAGRKNTGIQVGEDNTTDHLVVSKAGWRGRRDAELGIIRLEISDRYFNEKLGGDWQHVDRLSRLVYEYRCTDQSYARAPVSIYPIQRAEESLGAVFLPTETFIQRFYHLADL
jgi:hypothetical protein